MKKIMLLAVMVGLICSVGIASAHTMGEVTNTCPVCNHTFTCILDMSGTSFGMRLDLKPIGPTPAPWRVPVCTECSFVIYDKDISAEELARCKEIISREDYTKHADRASYFLLGLLYDGLGKEPLSIGHVFLKASWQEEEDSVKLKDDLELSLKHFEAYLGSGTSEDEEAFQTGQLLKGELLRRLGRFDEAENHLKEIQGKPGFQAGIMKDIVAYEIELCGQNDSAPHALSEMN